jgi:hypothetical protein
MPFTQKPNLEPHHPTIPSLFAILGFVSGSMIHSLQIQKYIIIHIYDRATVQLKRPTVLVTHHSERNRKIINGTGSPTEEVRYRKPFLVPCAAGLEHFMSIRMQRACGLRLQMESGKIA